MVTAEEPSTLIWVTCCYGGGITAFDSLAAAYTMAEWSESVAQKGEDLGSTPGGADAVFVWLTILPNSSGWLHLPKGVGTDHK